VTATGPDQFVIVFRPARSAPAVAQVIFEGNKVIPSTVLQNAIHGVAIGLSYTEPAFREVLQNAVRPLYEARGRIRVAFPKIVTEPARDVQGLVVRVTVQEGASYDLGEISLDNKSDVKSDELLKAGNFKKGDIANFDDVARGLEQIRKRLRRQGYMRAETKVDRAINDEKKAVDLLVHVLEGPRFTFANLNIEGLDINGEAAIKRLWNLKEGKPFNADYPDYFLEQVRERGLFDDLGKTRSAVKIDEQNHTVDVTLYFAKGSDAASPKPPERREPGY
jgi:outer membrane protein assembly factor BamA